jgi:hypothetical protein
MKILLANPAGSLNKKVKVESRAIEEIKSAMQEIVNRHEKGSLKN